MNNVPMVKHVAFFESVKLKEKAVPIQKMITVPILHGGEAVGVAQISRKGETPREAGPDFTPSDPDSFARRKEFPTFMVGRSGR